MGGMLGVMRFSQMLICKRMVAITNNSDICETLKKDIENQYVGNKDKIGLDRIDNNKGHILENCVLCCETCNMTRGNRFSYDEMIEIGNVIKKNVS